VRFLTRRSSCNPKTNISFDSPKKFQSLMHVKIPNKVRLAFNVPKAKPFKGVGKLS
jgi:hypothetical protein